MFSGWIAELVSSSIRARPAAWLMPSISRTWEPRNRFLAPVAGLVRTSRWRTRGRMCWAEPLAHGRQRGGHLGRYGIGGYLRARIDVIVDRDQGMELGL